MQVTGVVLSGYFVAITKTIRQCGTAVYKILTLKLIVHL